MLTGRSHINTLQARLREELIAARKAGEDKRARQIEFIGKSVKALLEAEAEDAHYVNNR